MKQIKWLDQVSEISPEVLKTLKVRVKGSKPSFYIARNPLIEKSWILKYKKTYENES